MCFLIKFVQASRSLCLCEENRILLVLCEGKSEELFLTMKCADVFRIPETARHPPKDRNFPGFNCTQVTWKVTPKRKFSASTRKKIAAEAW